MALLNRTALLEYDVPGPVVIHERAILQHLSGDEYAVLTPDGDVYIEEMAVTNSDLRSFRLRPAPGVLPPGVLAAQVYGLPVFTPADMAGYRAEAQRVVAAELAARGGGAVIAQAAVPAVAGIGAGCGAKPSGWSSSVVSCRDKRWLFLWRPCARCGSRCS